MRQAVLLRDPLWSVLRAPCSRNSSSWRAICEVAAHRGEFFIHGVVPHGQRAAGTFALRFRCGGASPSRHHLPCCTKLRAEGHTSHGGCWMAVHTGRLDSLQASGRTRMLHYCMS